MKPAITALIAVSMCCVGGCSGSEEPEPASSPSAEVSQADDATAAQAAAAVITLADLGDGWTEFAPAEPYHEKGISVDECINPEGGPLADLPFNATHAGPQLTNGSNVYVRSWAAVFADDATAEERFQYVDSTAYDECFRKVLEDGADDSNGDVTVAVGEDPEASFTEGSGTATVARFDFSIDGTASPNSVIVTTYRSGPIVVTTVDDVAFGDDAALTSAYEDISAAQRALLARLDGS